MADIIARLLLDSSRFAEGWQLLDLSVDSTGSPIALYSERVQPEGPFDPSYQTRGRIVHFRAGTARAITVVPYHSWFSSVQALPDGHWLLVCRAFDSGDDVGLAANARVYDGDGRLVRSFSTHGDASLVQTSPSGDCWVGYTDVGIFSHRRSGLACFDSYGNQLFDYGEAVQRYCQTLGIGHDDPLARVLRMMADCYALNVISDDEVWISYYTPFPLVRVKASAIDRVLWALAPRGTMACAICGDTVMFDDGYDEGGHLYRVDISAAVTHPAEPVRPIGTKLRVVAIDGTALGTSRTFARGATLYVRDAHCLFAIDA